jgi:diketogulonate reductase-like aldo/keto reductase
MIFITVDDKNVPALGFGTWQLRGGDCVSAVAKAIDIGYRHIDTAQIYENEAEVGAGIAGSGIERKEIFLTTKVWMNVVKDGALQSSVAESLKKLKTDYVDLLLVHWPVTEVPFAEQMKALKQVQAEGRARLIGVSNFTVAQMQEVRETLKTPIVTNQVEYHPFLSQRPVLDYINAHGMFLTAYSPLARGKVNDSKILTSIGRKIGKTPGQVALRWLLEQDNVAAIPKAGSEKHMRENFEIFDFSLTEDEMREIHAEARSDGRMINPAWAPKWDKAA